MLLLLLLAAAVASPWCAVGLECPLRPKNVSCSDQMPHLDLRPEDCIVEYYIRNSSACAALELRGDSMARTLGVVRMRPFVWSDDEGTSVTAINVTFLDVRWSRVVLRFTSLGAVAVTNFCRGLRLSQRALSLALSGERPPRLHFHCPWCDTDCERQPFSLEYAASAPSGRYAEYGRFLFNMPLHNYLDVPGLPFPYVEVSSLPTAHVRWASPPPPADGANYSVATLVGARQTAARTVAASRGSLAVALGAGQEPWGGAPVSFSVRALLPNCSLCDDVHTPPITLERSAYASYVWAAVGVLAMVSAMFLTGRLLCRRGADDCIANKKVKGVTTVVLVYRHASDGHVAVVRQLADFLRAAGGFRVLLDEEDIPRCPDKDPLAWYTEQMLGADVALVVASPTPAPAPATAGVYGVAAAAAEGLVGPRLSRGGRCEALALPGRPHLPPPARGLRLLRARRPSHLRRLVRRLHAGGGRGSAAAASSSHSKAAARALLRMAQDTADSDVCHHQEPSEMSVDDSSGFLEKPKPVFANESPVPQVKYELTSPTGAISSFVDLQKMDLLGPELSEEDTQDDEDDGHLREINVTIWTSGGEPKTISLEL